MALAQDQSLWVDFYSGWRYLYHEVPKDTAEGVFNYFSKGKAVWEYLRGHFSWTKHHLGGKSKSPFPDPFEREREAKARFPARQVKAAQNLALGRRLTARQRKSLG